MSNFARGELPTGYQLRWDGAGTIHAHQFDCGHCGRSIASDRGWTGFSTYDNKPSAFVYICPFCMMATFVDHRDKQFPSVRFGHPVTDIAEADVASLYDEARHAVGAGAYTAAVLACRKLLMHIAVSKGATENGSFVGYVEFLAAKSYVPPDAKEWVDHIRQRSNEANHEIVLMQREDAEELVQFSEMLLKMIFEFPARARRRAATTL